MRARTDLVNAERFDTVARDCELVIRQLSRDPYSSFDGQHETHAEPHGAAWGRTIVVAYQVGRHEGGGADNIGWARSGDGGRTAGRGNSPSLTLLSRPAGSYELATDPVVAYDAAHGRWLIASLAFGADGAQLVVSGSRDGRAWSAPVTRRAPGEDPDKEWLACDNRASSRLRGRCYLAYMDFEANELRVRSSTDGGRTWRPAVTVPTGACAPLVVSGAAGDPTQRRPRGHRVRLRGDRHEREPCGRDALDRRGRDLAGARDRVDPQRVADHRCARRLPHVRDDRRRRTIYAVWSDCRFRECEANDVVLSTSRDGVRWTGAALVRRPMLDFEYDDDFILPAIAAAQSSRRVAIVFHALRAPTRCVGGCELALDVWLVESGDGARTWSAPRRLNADPLQLGWLARSTLGAFVGDYVGIAYATGAPDPGLRGGRASRRRGAEAGGRRGARRLTRTRIAARSANADRRWTWTCWPP